MAPNEGFVDLPEEPFEKEYLAPVHRVGFWTCIAISVAMFLPALLLYLLYGVFAPWAGILAGMGLALTYAVPFFFIEPISYYPIYGDAGNYMSMTTGNVSNLRLPCAAVAQAVAGVPEGTRKGAVIACIGIAVSVIAGVIGVFFGSLAGGWITAQFPKWLTDAFKVYLLPAVWGAVFGQFALRGPMYAIPALIIAGIPLVLGWKAYFIIPIAVFGTVLVAYAMYKWFKIAPKAG
ncbi:MAG: hypothetical protein H5T68_01890 [Chloroflexi bacterium]|nr:hypothetical protein [Chloroflexota bacterium]